MQLNPIPSKEEITVMGRMECCAGDWRGKKVVLGKRLAIPILGVLTSDR